MVKGHCHCDLVHCFLLNTISQEHLEGTALNLAHISILTQGWTGESLVVNGQVKVCVKLSRLHRQGAASWLVCRGIQPQGSFGKTLRCVRGRWSHFGKLVKQAPGMDSLQVTTGQGIALVNNGNGNGNLISFQLSCQTTLRHDPRFAFTLNNEEAAFCHWTDHYCYFQQGLRTFCNCESLTGFSLSIVSIHSSHQRNSQFAVLSVLCVLSDCTEVNSTPITPCSSSFTHFNLIHHHQVKNKGSPTDAFAFTWQTKCSRGGVNPSEQQGRHCIFQGSVTMWHIDQYLVTQTPMTWCLK